VSPGLAVACDRLRRLAASEGELLIVGETGVGKEVYARAVHGASGRKGRFMAINCAAIPRELVESELFGYRAGAHSTAHQAKPGLIEEAEGGTLFLDEIGEMTGEAQIKLLRFLQDRELTPLGATRPRRMHVRIIAATNRPATLAGGKGPAGLRDDIVGRLGAAPIHLPPLRSRIEDLGALVAHFLRATPGVTFEQPAFRALCLHTWPLNVRELEKIVSTAAVLSAGAKPIGLRDLPEPIARAIETAPAAGPRRTSGPSPTPAQLEELLRRYEGNVADVSRELGKHRAAVWRWIKKFGIGPQKFRKGAGD
jgi:two-component system, NtrC family, response regulator